MVAMQMLYLRTMESLRSFRDREEGQGLVEYTLILGAIAVGAVVILGNIGGWIETTLTAVETALP